MCDQPKNQSNLEMHADRVSMPDGRYLIYYTFVAAADNEEIRETGDAKPGTRDVILETGDLLDGS